MRTISTERLMRAALTWWDRYTSPDLRQFFGIDTYPESADMDRSWRWLYNFIIALADIPQSRLMAELEDDSK